MGRSGMRVRKLLRQLYPAEAPGSGGRWDLSDEQVAEVLEYFRSGQAHGSAAIAVGAPIVATAGVPTIWFWEGHVQEAMAAHLRRQGWAILSTSDTASRARGEDITATKDGRRLLVEVKGYPSKNYRDPRRAGEVKRTDPRRQAKHWYADGLLHLLRLRGSQPDAELAMALPQAPRYRALIADTENSLMPLGIGVFMVGADGSVEHRVRTGYERDLHFGWRPGDVELIPPPRDVGEDG